jgi:O-methyltransferase/aklanonic acid methyltransferase
MTDEPKTERQRVIGVFNRVAASYDRAGPRFFSHFGQQLVRLAQLTPGLRVLDVAAGRGAVLFPAASQVGATGQAVGIDLSDDMVRETTKDIRDAEWKHVEMHLMDAEHMRFPDSTFDRVLCGFSLWFFPHPDEALGEFLRVLRPGGRVCLTTWAQDCPALCFARQVLRPHLPAGSTGHLKQGTTQFDTPAQLGEALRRAGFSDVEVAVEDADFTYVDEEEWWASLWAQGVRAQLEKLTPLALEQVRAEFGTQLQAFRQPDGFHLVFRALVAHGTKHP